MYEVSSLREIGGKRKEVKRYQNNLSLEYSSHVGYWSLKEDHQIQF